jgi:hypothetical protein
MLYIYIYIFMHIHTFCILTSPCENTSQIRATYAIHMHVWTYLLSDIPCDLCMLIAHARPRGICDLEAVLPSPICICMHVCVCVCMYVCIYAWIYVCMMTLKLSCLHPSAYVCMYACIYARMNISAGFLGNKKSTESQLRI